MLGSHGLIEDRRAPILLIYYTYTTLIPHYIIPLLFSAFIADCSMAAFTFQWSQLRPNSNDHCNAIHWEQIRMIRNDNTHSCWHMYCSVAGHTLINHGIATYWCNKSIRSLPVTTILIVKTITGLQYWCDKSITGSRDCNRGGVTNPLALFQWPSHHDGVGFQW